MKMETTAPRGILVRIVAFASAISLAQGANTWTVTSSGATSSGDAGARTGTLKFCCERSASGDTVVFDPSVTMIDMLTEVALIDGKSLTIDGNGAVTLTRSVGGGAILEFKDTNAGSYDWTVRGLKFSNTTISSSGGIVWCRDNANQNSGLILNACSFVGIACTNTVLGGTVTVQTGSATTTKMLTVRDCVFEGNQTQNGGAIYSVSAVDISGSVFSNNLSRASGGAIYVTPGRGGTNVLEDCLFWGNTTVSSYNDLKRGGGALFLAAATTAGSVITGVVNRCAFVDNVASNAPSFSSNCGGAIHTMRSRLSIKDSLFRGNRTLAGTANWYGGGAIYAIRYDGDGTGFLELDGCTVMDNEAQNRGGGVYVSGQSAARPMTCRIVNSTISGNSVGTTVDGRGAGLYQALYTSLELHNSTVADNTGKEGGGLYEDGNNTALALSSTILSSNTATTSPNVAGTIDTQASSLVDGAPLLASLADNGGPVLPGGLALLTQAIGTASPCYNTGANPLALAFDQRGTPYVRANGTTDIGAFEYQILGGPVATILLVR